MTTIALHKYSRKIEQLIEDHQLDDAINHCRHILQQHPRHVDTYRTLAKAYLERGNYLDAVDLIYRILSTEPSDMIAHVGLSIAFKEQSKLDQSIWHLERALDVEPYNTALREELLDLYTLKKSTLPDSVAPSSAALARMYLKSEMYNAAVLQLRHSLTQEPDRIDLKVMLAETLYWANQRVEAVSLSLEILDVLPNCIPINAILAEIWLQTGRVAEAQTYLQRLQAMTQLDKAHLIPETAVGRAFNTRGAPPIPDEVIVEQFGDEPLMEPDSGPSVIAMVDSDWIEEFSMEETAEHSEDESVEMLDEDDEGVTGWLLEAALSSGEKFGTRPLVMPSDPLEAETDWFIDSNDDDEESLEELLGDVGDDAQLEDWLTDLDAKVSGPLTDESEEEGKTGFSGMLTGLLDSELDIADDTAVPSGFTDLFEDVIESEAEESDDTAVISPDLTDLFEEVPESQTEDASVLNLAELAEFNLDQYMTDENDKSLPHEPTSETVDDSFAEGLTALFSDMDSSDSKIDDSLDDTDDMDLDAFLASDLVTLAEAGKSDEEDQHSGFTQLFDQLSTDAFPEELDEPEALDSDWLTPTTDALAPDLSGVMDDEVVPDWLAEVKQDEFEPVQIDPKLTVDWHSEPEELTELVDEVGQSDWLTAGLGDEPEMDALDEGDWLAELAGDGPSGDGLSDEKLETAVPDSRLPESDDLSDIPTWMLGGEKDAQALETRAPIDFAESVGFETDELDEATAVPTWLLGGDKTSDETGSLDESAPLDDIKPPDSAQLRENPQTILAGAELPGWLREPESDEQDDLAKPDPLQTDSMIALVNKDLPNWLTGELPELDESDEPVSETADPLSTDSMADLVSGDLPNWLLDDEPDIEAQPIPEPDSELDLYKDDVNIPDWLMADFSTGQDQAEVSVTSDKNEREPIPPQEPEELSEGSFEPNDDDNLGWLEDLAEPTEEPAEVGSADEAESASYASRVAAGEGGAVDELPTQVSMPDELPDFGDEPDMLSWLEAKTESESDSTEEQPPQDLSQTESEVEDVLAGVTGELNADLDWLDSLAEESAGDGEPDDQRIDEFDSGTGWLDDLTIVGDTGPLAELGSEPILPDFADSLGVLPDEPEEGMGWLSELEEHVDPTGEGELAEMAGETDEFVETAVSPESETDDVLNVLDELAIEHDESFDDLLDLNDESDDLEIGEDLAVDLPEATDLVDSVTSEPPESIDDAMAWLEDLAAGQGAPLEELPSVVDGLATEPELEILQEPTDEPDTDDFEIETGFETDVSAIAEPESEIEDSAPEDIDDAMAWLEGLAAKQGARLEELPSMAEAEIPQQDSADEIISEDPDTSLEWLEDLTEDTVGGADAPFDLSLEDDLASVDASLDWLEEMPETEDAVEKLPEQASEELVEATEEVPDSLDDAMVWLDALAEEQDAPDEALSDVIDETAVPDKVDPLADLAELDAEPSFEDTPADLDDAMGWLEDLAAEQDTPLEDLPTIAGVVDEALFVESDAEEALEPEPEAPTDDLAEALDWLEQLALKDSGPLEMPVGETAVSDSEDDLAEALDWLDQLSQPEETVEKPTAGIVDLADLSDDMPEDPDEALAWLQQVAAEQEEIDVTELASTNEDEFAVDLFELPEAAEMVEPEAALDVAPADEIETGEPEVVIDVESAEEIETGETEPVNDIEPAEEIATDEHEVVMNVEPSDALEESTVAETDDDILAEMPDDPEAMMAWLERLAARQGAKLEELPSVSADDMLDLADGPIVESEEPADIAESLVEISPDEFEDLPQNEDDVAWLDDLIDVAEETAVETVDDETQSSIEFEGDALPEADLAELDVPEDTDDAMAWLEALAAQQGAKLEELPTLSGTGALSPESLDEVEVVAETAVTPDSQETLTDVSELEAEVEVPSDSSGTDETSDIPDEELVEEESYLSEGLEEALPDWLDADSDSLEEMTGQTEWLSELEEPDIEGWLDEEETTISSRYDSSVQSRFEPSSDSGIETESLSLSVDTLSGADLFDMPEDEIDTTIFSVDDEKLAAARQAVENDMFDDALETYQTLVDAGGGMMTLIADLETVAVDHPEQPLFRHLLGDAYMRNGQLQKALETYRVALDQI